MELRLQLCNYLHRKFGLSYDAKTQTLVKVKASEKINLTLRAIILPYFNNPTGAIMDREDLEKIVSIL